MKQFILIILFTIIGSVAFAQKGNKDVYYGNKSYREGDLKTAVKLYQKALDVEPENKAARINLAIAQSKLLATEASAENFDKALAGNKNNPALEAKLNYDKGTALAKGKKYEPAIDAFK
ncbi:MAG TPA: tetratricopeptide repeat protein, partial [Arachidicoccus sp.]|nr:tetratricopeptide repeat protein [Arachidicoccus sp.]